MSETAIAPLTDKQEMTVHDPTEKWSDDFALKVVMADFHAAENYRTSNCDWRWTEHDRLFLAWADQKYWEGTRMPRASMAVHVAFEQVESMLPKLIGGLFSDDPWFQAGRVGDTTAEQAAQWRDRLDDQLNRTGIREVADLAATSALIHGDGIMKLSWQLEEKERLVWIPRMQQSVMGQGYERVLDKRTVKYMDNRPDLEWVPIKDFYIDPNCISHNLHRHARYVVHRKLVTVDDLDALRDREEWKIPPIDTLIRWATQRSSVQGDITKGAVEAFRMGSWNPGMIQTADPGGKYIEYLEYCTDNRMVVVCGREKAILNVPNSYGFKPYYHLYYSKVLGRFYSQGVCDVIEGEQALQSGLLRGRLDEIALTLHRPMVKKLGVKMPAYSQRVRPGQMWEAEKPKEDIVFMDAPNTLQNAYIETSASEQRVQKITGQNDLYASGTPSSAGNAAARTATGVGAQVQAASSRIQYLVSKWQDEAFEPMLNHLVTLNHMFPPLGTAEGDTIAMSKVNVWMRAAAKMKAQSFLLQTFPLVFQAMANPGMAQELALTNEAINWREVLRVVSDMTGYREFADLIRPMSQEEQEARKQPPPEEMMRQQMQRERIQGQQMIQRERLLAEGELEREKQASTDQTEDIYALVELAKQLIAKVGQEEKANEGSSKKK